LFSGFWPAITSKREGFVFASKMPGFVNVSSNNRKNRRRRVPVRGQNQTTRKITSETETSSDTNDSDIEEFNHPDESTVVANVDYLALELRDHPKHPLKDSWTFWCLDIGRSKNWEECLVPLNTFEHVEDFWALFHHLASINDMKSGSDYMMFKKGIQPKWEDPLNRSGGRWMIKLEPQNRAEGINQQAWTELLLLLISGLIEGADKVTGAVCNVRRMCDKLSLWMSDCSDEASINGAGCAFQAALEHWQFRQPFRFERHSDVEAKNCSQAKALYTLPPYRPRHN